MKHIVTLTISNPAHEHISLRRRQSTTNYMVEARDEAEAIFRAANHFKKLGNYVHNAVIAESTLNEEVEQIDEAVKVGPKNHDKSTDTVWHGVHHDGQEIGTIGTHSAQHVEKHGKWGFEDSRGYGRRHGEPEMNSKEEALEALINRHKEYAKKKTNEEVDLDEAYRYGTATTPDVKARYYKAAIVADDKRWKRKYYGMRERSSVFGQKTSPEDPLQARQKWINAKGFGTGNPKADRARRVKSLMRMFPMRTEEVEQIDEVGNIPSGLEKLKSVEARALGRMDAWYKNPKSGYSSTPPEVRRATKTSVRASNRINRDPTTGKPFAYANLKKEEVEQVSEEDALKARQEWMNAKGVSTGDPKADRARKVKRLMQTFPMQTFPMKKEEVESIDEVNAMHSPEAMQAVLTPTAKIVRAAVGKTARDKAATKKYARRVAKFSPYSKKDVMDDLKSMGEEVEQVVEKAPPGAKYERMVNHIKDKYSEDGTLTPQEKAIAYATAWKAKNSGK